MHHTNDYHGLGKYAHGLITNKARELARRPGFGSSDRDDIEQELALDLIVRLRNYDPAKARRTTFMARIVEHRIATLIEERNAACRDWRLRADAGDRDSFDSDGLGDAESALDLIPDPACDSAEDITLRIDLESVLDALPEDLRGLWDLLLESSIPQISKQTGIPSSTLYDRRKRLRRALHESGL